MPADPVNEGTSPLGRPVEALRSTVPSAPAFDDLIQVATALMGADAFVRLLDASDRTSRINIAPAPFWNRVLESDVPMVRNGDPGTGSPSEFQCGAAIVVDGEPVGLLGVVDREARSTSPAQLLVFAALARAAATLLGAHREIERARRAADRALDGAKARLAATFDAVQVGIMVVSPEGGLLRANPEAERVLGIEAGTTEFVGGALGFEMLALDGASIPTQERPVAGALMGREVRGTMMRLRWRDGREMCIHANAVPLWNAGESKPYAAVCSFLDISAEVEQRRLLDERLAEVAEVNILLESQRYELELANERLAALATTDGLTGLLNHRAFHERLETETHTSHRSGSPLSLLLMDVDRFKQYNDRFGHPAGDVVLREFARVLSEASRAGDVMARYGGEEFVAILPNTDATAAVAVAERLRHAVGLNDWPEHPVTANFGAATLTALMNGDDLVRFADVALYASKRAGRDRTTHAHEALPV